MTTPIICAAALLLSFWAGSRALRQGLLAVMAIGYGYGILRANLPDTWTFLTFDAAVVGLYLSQLWRPLDRDTRIRSHSLRVWLALLIGWPTLLFFFAPGDAMMIELVGLRGNVFLLPFLYLGARLEQDDLYWLSVRVAVVNLAAVGIGIAEFFMGIEQFFPPNEVTNLIYRSRDIAEQTAYRIPATFSSAHVFAGTMVVTLPLLLGTWMQPVHERRWHGQLLLAAVIASLIGIFMAATRTHVLVAAVLVGAVTVWGRLRGGKRLRWALVLGVIAYTVAGEERLQRFTTLQDTEFVASRFSGSVNSAFFEVMTTYPLGNGLANGGTSVPYFLRETSSPMVLENEFARIALEQGIPGVGLWIGFLLWALLPWPRGLKDPAAVARRLAWVTVTACFAFSLTGIGLFAAMPQAPIMLMTMGWFVAAHDARRHALAFTPSARRPDNERATVSAGQAVFGATRAPGRVPLP